MLRVLIGFLLAPLLLFGGFTFEERGDGAYFVTYKGEGVQVETIFPERPSVEGSVASYINSNPLVQLNLIIGPRSPSDTEEIAKSILDSVVQEYKVNQDAVTKVKEIPPVESKAFGAVSYYAQFIIDTTDGIREFLSMNIYRSDETDVLTLTRFIITASETNNLNYRVKGNSIAALFHKRTKVQFTLE